MCPPPPPRPYQREMSDTWRVFLITVTAGRCALMGQLSGGEQPGALQPWPLPEEAKKKKLRVIAVASGPTDASDAITVASTTPARRWPPIRDRRPTAAATTRTRSGGASACHPKVRSVRRTAKGAPASCLDSSIAQQLLRVFFVFFLPIYLIDRWWSLAHPID